MHACMHISVTAIPKMCRFLLFHAREEVVTERFSSAMEFLINLNRTYTALFEIIQ